MKRIDEYIDGYFEGTLSEEEELRLKVFLASEAGQAPEYDEVRAVMGFFATGKAIKHRRHWPRITAVAAGLAMLVTLGVNSYYKENICVSFVNGRKVTDKVVVMNDVDNTLADLFTGGTDVEEQLLDIFKR